MNLRQIFRGGILVAFCSVASHEANIVAPQAQQASADTKVVTAQALASTGSTSEAPAATPQRVTKYTLPPDRYQKAHNLAKIHFRLALISFVYGLVVLWLVLHWKISAKYRTLAESTSSRRILQALVYGVIRKSPRRWWFYFWLVSLPILLLVLFLQPLIIDPLFNKFEPLQQKDPALTASLEKLAQRAGQNIPPERMFWMNASEKTTAVDAYVTGFGASKRIVVLDTTIAKATTPEIVYVAGHEMGHYVLQHIPKPSVGAAGFCLCFSILASAPSGGFWL